MQVRGEQEINARDDDKSPQKTQTKAKKATTNTRKQIIIISFAFGFCFCFFFNLFHFHGSFVAGQKKKSPNKTETKPKNSPHIN